MSIVARAPGKVILLGEHAVVYGHPALAGALTDGVVVEATPGMGSLRIPAWGVAVRAGDATPLARAYAAILERLSAEPGWSAPEVDLTARFDLPSGAGLGSSAALSVAIARALGLAAAHPVEGQLLLETAMAAETVFHGRASGIDHAVAALGGFGLFTRKSGLEPLAAAQPVPLVIGHTGRARDTAGRVARVAELYASSDETKTRFQAIEQLVARAVAAIAEGRFGDLGAAMDENQRHLSALEVSCPEIDALCRLAHDAGAVGAKLTGGGGGGCVIALAPGREEAVRAAWAHEGYASFVTSVGGRPS
jgi:mevalonate kinase